VVCLNRVVLRLLEQTSRLPACWRSGPGENAWPIGCAPHRGSLDQRASRRPWRCVIASREGSWQYAEDFVPEDTVVKAARRRAADAGITPVSSGAGAALRFLAALVQARSVVEVGTGTGVSGLWLLRGMAPDGVLTTVDLEGEHLRLAREAFTAEGVPATRTRLITGRALDVLPRLADGSYDLVFIDGPSDEIKACIEESVRLLRPGGLVVVGAAFGRDKVADPAQRDAETVARRGAVNAMRDDERFLPVLLSSGDGLLAAIVV
jgi:predicted O-methyltransferase YrrM